MFIKLPISKILNITKLPHIYIAKDVKQLEGGWFNI